MKKIFFLLFAISAQSTAFGQKNYTIVFQPVEISFDSVKPSGSTLFHLVIRDSISYCYHPELVPKKNMVDTTLGKSYAPKGSYFDVKKQIAVTWLDKKTVYYSEVEKGQWSMTGEEKIICGYRCIKANGIVMKRRKTAWYAPELPAGFGPYSLFGLPGTILEIIDSTGWGYVAIEVQKAARPIVIPVGSKAPKILTEIR